MSKTSTENTSSMQSAPDSLSGSWGPAALDERRQRIASHLGRLAQKREYWIDQNRYYYTLLARLLRFLVEPAKRVLSIRCSTGELLAAVAPSCGVGVEITEEMTAVARQRHPEFTFETAFPDTDTFQNCFQDSRQTFDYILVGEIDDTVDVQRALQNLHHLCERHTRLIITTYNHLWEPLVTLAEFLGMKVPRLEQNWFSSGDMATLLQLSGYELVGRRNIVLCPKYIPLLASVLNGICARLPGKRVRRFPPGRRRVE